MKRITGPPFASIGKFFCGLCFVLLLVGCGGNGEEVKEIERLREEVARLKAENRLTDSKGVETDRDASWKQPSFPPLPLLVHHLLWDQVYRPNPMLFQQNPRKATSSCFTPPSGIPKRRSFAFLGITETRKTVSSAATSPIIGASQAMPSRASFTPGSNKS